MNTSKINKFLNDGRTIIKDSYIPRIRSNIRKGVHEAAKRGLLPKGVDSLHPLNVRRKSDEQVGITKKRSLYEKFFPKDMYSYTRNLDKNIKNPKLISDPTFVSSTYEIDTENVPLKDLSLDQLQELKEKSKYYMFSSKKQRKSRKPRRLSKNLRKHRRVSKKYRRVSKKSKKH